MDRAAEPRLLASDREAIDRAARVLGRGSGFVIVVCAPDLQPAARSALEEAGSAVRSGERVDLRAGLAVRPAEGGGPAAGGFTMLPTVSVGSAEQMLALLVAAAEAAEGAPVVSLALDERGREALVTLNLHREKLLEGAPVVLWLPGVEVLAAMREVAPDAYSFRSAIVPLQGDGGALPRRKKDEPDDVAAARRRYRRAKTRPEKARAGHDLAEVLRVAGQLEEASRVAREALGALAPAKSEEELEIQAILLITAAGIARGMGLVGQQVSLLRQAAFESESLPLSKGVPRRAFALACLPGPFNFDRQSAEEALDLARRWGMAPFVLSQALRSMAIVRISLGDIHGAEQALEQCRPLLRLLTPFEQALIHQALARCRAMIGDLGAADSYVRESARLLSAESADGLATDYHFVQHLLERSELAAAERALDDMELSEGAIVLIRALRAHLLLLHGRVVECLSSLEEALSESARRGQDGNHLAASRQLADFAEVAHDAGRLLPEELTRIVATLDAAEGVSLALTAPDTPPWYPILFHSLHSRVRGLVPALLPEAVPLAREALDLARSTYPDLVPQCGRELAERLIRARAPEEALAALQEIEPEAAARGMLKELAKIRAAQVRALVLQSAPLDAVDERMRALRDVLDATGSPRIAAETLLGLATDLPPSCMHPDVLALAEETQVVFFEMPMPAQEARATELAGDALRARGRPAEASRRYAAARARLERFGLGLRIPLLDCKLGGNAPAGNEDERGDEESTAAATTC